MEKSSLPLVLLNCLHQNRKMKLTKYENIKNYKLYLAKGEKK